MLNEPIVIGGQEVCLIPDFVGNPSRIESDSARYTQVEYLEQVNATCFVNDDELSKQQYAHPNIPVYGLWQTLIISGVIEQAGNYFYPSASGKNDGFLFSVKESGGKLFADATARVLKGESSLMIDPATATLVDIKPLDLKVPSQFCRTKTELFREQRDVKRNAWMLVAGIVALIWLAAGSYVFFADQNVKAKKEELSKLESESAALHNQLERLKQTKTSASDDYTGKLKRIVILKLFDSGLATIADNPSFQPNSFINDGDGFISSIDVKESALKEIDFINYEKLQNGRFVLTMKARGDQ